MSSSFTLDSSSPYPWIPKSQDASLDYTLDLASWLAQGETLTAATWSVPAQLTKGTESHTNTTATVKVSGGTLGAAHLVTCTFTTNQGRIDSRTLELRITRR